MPGDFYEFTVDVENTGSIDAMLESVSSKLGNTEITTGTLPTYLEYSVAYSNGTPITAKQQLNSGDTETIKVRLAFKTDIEVTDLPGTAQTLNLNLQMSYVQKDDMAIPVRVTPNNKNIIFAIDNSYDKNSKMDTVNNALAQIVNYMDDDYQIAYTAYSSSATNPKVFSKSNVPQIFCDVQSHGTNFSSALDISYDYLVDKSSNGKIGVIVILTNGIPERTNSENNDFEAMYNTLAAANSRAKRDGMKIYVLNVSDLCNVNETVIEKGYKIVDHPRSSKKINNSIMKLLSSEYENVSINYETTNGVGVVINNYNKVNLGEKYYACINSNDTNYYQIFANIFG